LLLLQKYSARFAHPRGILDGERGSAGFSLLKFKHIFRPRPLRFPPTLIDFFPLLKQVCRVVGVKPGRPPSPPSLFFDGILFQVFSPLLNFPLPIVALLTPVHRGASFPSLSRRGNPPVPSECAFLFVCDGMLLGQTCSRSGFFPSSSISSFPVSVHSKRVFPTFFSLLFSTKKSVSRHAPPPIRKKTRSAEPEEIFVLPILPLSVVSSTPWRQIVAPPSRFPPSASTR